MVSNPWPGRKSIAMPASRRKRPDRLRTKINSIEMAEVCRGKVVLLLSLRKQSCGNLPTSQGMSSRLRMKVQREIPASQPSRG